MIEFGGYQSYPVILNVMVKKNVDENDVFVITVLDC